MVNAKRRRAGERRQICHRHVGVREAVLQPGRSWRRVHPQHRRYCAPAARPDAHARARPPRALTRVHARPPRADQQVGHYTQIVWHSTRFVGCGVSECGDDRALWVCQYYPAGNWVSELPFCKHSKPSDMGKCATTDSLPDPAGLECRSGTGSCGSTGGFCSGRGTGGATTCGKGTWLPVYNCKCENGISAAGSSGLYVGDTGTGAALAASALRLLSVLSLCVVSVAARAPHGL